MHDFHIRWHGGVFVLLPDLVLIPGRAIVTADGRLSLTEKSEHGNGLRQAADRRPAWASIGPS
jgi:hypothetical protein